MLFRNYFNLHITSKIQLIGPGVSVLFLFLCGFVVFTSRCFMMSLKLLVLILSVLFNIVITSLGKRELVYMLLMQLFMLYVFVSVSFSLVDCSLCLWHSLTSHFYYIYLMLPVQVKVNHQGTELSKTKWSQSRPNEGRQFKMPYHQYHHTLQNS